MAHGEGAAERVLGDFGAQRDGPLLVLVGGVHGNEPAGVEALRDFCGELAPRAGGLRGRVLVLAGNLAGLAAGRRFVDEDLNRVWTPATLDGPGRSVELDRARSLRPHVDAADYLLDIHSMLEPSPPVMICGPLDKGIRFAFEVGVPQHVVSDAGHSNGTRMRDYGGFGDPASPKNALLVECGQHWERAAERVASQTTWRFLARLGVVDPAQAAREIDPGQPAPQRLIRVTDAVIASSPAFRFARPFSGLDVVPHAGDVIAWDGETPVRAPYDNCVLVMPVPHNVKTGLTAVRLGRLEAP